MTIVLDTSALIHWSFNPERLSRSAEALISSSEEILISSISLWEIALKHRQGRLQLPVTPDFFAKELETVDRTKILSVDWATWLESVSLEWDHPDPADRCIVALARRQACDLVTSDQEIRKFYPQSVW